ncbi:hypothetical protein ACROYT_G013745 [Oculina patagonica]
MFAENLLATFLSVLIAVAAVILVILFGWFVVWKMFLIRFSFIWELVYGGSNGNINKTSENVPLRRSSRIRDMRSALCVLAKNTKLSYTMFSEHTCQCVPMEFELELAVNTGSFGIGECMIPVSGMPDCPQIA